MTSAGHPEYWVAAVPYNPFPVVAALPRAAVNRRRFSSRRLPVPQKTSKGNTTEHRHRLANDRVPRACAAFLDPCNPVKAVHGLAGSQLPHRSV